MLYVGAIGTVFAMMMTSLCKQFYQFILAQGILLGASMALLVCPMLALVGQHIKVKRAAAMGIVIAGSSLGGVVWPIVINELLQKPNIGFPWTMRIVGFIMLPLLLVSCLCCRPAPAPAPSAEQEQSSSESREPKARSKTDFSILKQPSMQLSCLAFFIIYFGMFSPFFFTTSYAEHQGFSENLSFYTISIVNGASFFGRILPGIVADRYGKFNCCILATCFAGVIALCWTRATSVAGLVIFAAAYGFTSGVSITYHYMWTNLTETGHPLLTTSLRSTDCYTAEHRTSHRDCFRVHITFVRCPSSPIYALTSTNLSVQWPVSQSAANLLETTDICLFRYTPE